MGWYPSYSCGNEFPVVQCVRCGRDIPGDEDCYYNDDAEYMCQDCEEAE